LDSDQHEHTGWYQFHICGSGANRKLWAVLPGNGPSELNIRVVSSLACPVGRFFQEVEQSLSTIHAVAFCRAYLPHNSKAFQPFNDPLLA
jgi:hypothetical protein